MTRSGGGGRFTPSRPPRPSLDETAELLHRRGLRATPQRQVIVKAVRSLGGHVTAESVFEQVRSELPSISLKTVYETLHSLVAVGELQELILGVGPTHFDTIVRPHHHLICLNCNRIQDIDPVECIIPPQQRRGFSVVRTEVTVWGRCPFCKKLRLERNDQLDSSRPPAERSRSVTS